jgi:adenylylsulfate kinase
MFKKKILIMGLPGSGKTTLGKELAPHLNATILNADQIRKKYNNFDFSFSGRLKQANTMRELADLEIKKGNNVIADFVCPKPEFRKIFNANYIIWVNTITKSKYEDTNKFFENPSKEEYDFLIKKKDAKFFVNLILKDLIKSK